MMRRAHKARHASDVVATGRRIAPKALLPCLLAAVIACTVIALTPAQALARTIRVGYYKFAGYQEISEDGTRSGYGYDFLQELARYAGWDYEYVGYDQGWATLQTMLDNGEIDILTSARKTPQREQSYLFSTEIGTSAGILTVKSGDARVTTGDYATYEGLRVGMIKDSSINSSFTSFAQDKGFSFTPVYYTNVDDLNAALQAGNDIDAICTTNLRKPQNEWILDEFDSANFYVMMNAKDTELQSEVNAAIAQMDLYSPGWRTTLRNKYYTPDTGDQISLTADEKNFLSTTGATTTFSVLVNPDDKPYSYFENGEAKGIVPTIFREIARRAGISIEFVETPDRAAYSEALRDGSAQIVADSLFDYDKAEKSERRLTVPYLEVPISQVSRNGTSTSNITVATTSQGDATYGGQVSIPEDATILTCSSLKECLDAVDSGKANVAYAFPYSIQHWQEEGNGIGLTVVMLPDASVSFAVSVSNAEDPRLLTILNKAVANVKESYVEQAVVGELTTTATQLSFLGAIRQNPIWLAIIAILLAGLAALGATVISRQHSFKLISEKNAELNAAVQRANEASEAKSDFLSSMSHDMRTPLNGIIGFTNFALAETDEDKRQEDLRKISQSSSILLGLVNDTLELSRIESGKYVLEPSWFLARDLIDGIIVVIREAADEKKITFSYSIDCQDGLALHADRLKIQELLLNLLSNAIKYTNPGGRIKLEISRSGGDDGSCHIIVSDNGIGISKEFLPHIFESFAQEGGTSSDARGGAGLGLAIVKRIVDLMGGTISVESEKGVGSTFAVELPVQTRMGIPEGVNGNPPSGTTGKDDIADTTIMLVEDNALNAEIATRLLEGRHATVIRACNGKQAIDVFEQTAPGEIDAILMDIHMPVMDGLTATRALRKLDRTDATDVPVIAMTADAYSEDVKKCLDAGMNGHVSKPIDPARFFETIGENLRKPSEIR